MIIVGKNVVRFSSVHRQQQPTRYNTWKPPPPKSRSSSIRASRPLWKTSSTPCPPTPASIPIPPCPIPTPTPRTTTSATPRPRAPTSAIRRPSPSRSSTPDRAPHGGAPTHGRGFQGGGANG